jgi:ABC-2 type transport system permease protein
MPSGSRLQANTETGWQRGFKQLLRRENEGWWKSRRWVVQAVIFLLVLNGLLFAVLSAPNETPGQPAPTAAEKVATSLVVFVTLAGIAPVIAVVISGQDSIIGEKQSGTAAWILSKPVSRSSFVLSKLIAHMLAYFLIIPVLQGAVCYVMLSVTQGAALPVLPFVEGMLLVYLNLLFYITLTLMLGTIFEARGGVIGIGLALAIGYQIFTQLAPWSSTIMPWGIIAEGGTASTLILGQTPATFLPVIATVLWCFVFTGVALWRFERAEF